MAALSNSTDDALFDAIGKNDLEAVKRALGNEANANAKKYNGDTALWEATWRARETKDFEIMKFLLGKGADPNLAGDHGMTPLNDEAFRGANTELIELLLDNGADINLRGSPDGRTPIFSAVTGGNPEITRFLLENKADPNLEEDIWGTPLHYAAYMGNREEIIDLLLEYKADPSLRRSSDDTTPLFQAVLGQEVESAKKLLRKDSDLTVVGKDNKTFLHMAVQWEKSELLDLFWNEKECPIDVNATTTEGETPLFFAAENGILSCVTWLIDRGAHVDVVSKSGVTPFLQAARGGNVKIAELLTSKLDSAIYAVDNEGRGAFHYAVERGRLDFLEWLCNKSREASEVKLELKKALDPNRTDQHGKTIIHHALEWCRTSAVEKALKFCEPNIVNQVDDLGNTPMHTALHNMPWQIGVLRLLMKNMSSRAMNTRNNEGESILSLLAGIDDYPVGGLLLDILKLPVDVEYNLSGDKPRVIGGNQDHAEYIAKKLKFRFSSSDMPSTVIFWAARNGARDLVEDSLSNTSYANDVDKRKVISEAVYWASAGNQSTIVTDLMKRYKKDILAEQKTLDAVQVAAFSGCESMVQRLLSYIRDDDKIPQSGDATGLYWAVTWEHEHARSVVRYLLMNGASPDAAADGGQTVLEWAQSQSQGQNKCSMLGLLESPIRVSPGQ